MEAESQAKQGPGHAADSQEQPQAQEKQEQSLLGAESSCDCPWRWEYSRLLSWTLAGPLNLASREKCELWLGAACGPAEREGGGRASGSGPLAGLPTPVYLPGCLHTHQWSRSKARKLTRSSSSSKAGPAGEETARIVSPSAPHPRTLSQSWAVLGPRGTYMDPLDYRTLRQYAGLWEGLGRISKGFGPG